MLGSAYYEASNPFAPVIDGWGQITSDPSIVIQAFVSRELNGTYYEAAVPSNSGSQEFEIPFDATIFTPTGDQFFTGFAIANLDPLLAAQVLCTARDQTGAVIPNVFNSLTGPPPSIAGFGHWAGYNFPALMGLRGTIDCTANTNIAATALRFLGNKAFSSLPVIDKALAATPSGTALPQFAAQDVWTTGIFAINTSAAPANFSITFWQDNGAPQPVPFASGTSSTLGQFILPANGSGYYETINPSGPLLSGWGRITADTPIVIQSLFRENSSGTYYEAAVPSNVGSKEFVIPFDATTFAATGQPFFTGFAIANMDSANAANVTCVARNGNGATIANAFTTATGPPILNASGTLGGIQFPGPDRAARHHRLHFQHRDRRHRAALHRQHRVFVASGDLQVAAWRSRAPISGFFAAPGRFAGQVTNALYTLRASVTLRSRTTARLGDRQNSPATWRASSAVSVVYK